jgi:hypothetical protein
MKANGETIIPTNRPIWVPCMDKPNADSDGKLPLNERSSLKFTTPSLWVQAVPIARSEFGCGWLINIENFDVVQVGPSRG